MERHPCTPIRKSPTRQERKCIFGLYFFYCIKPRLQSETNIKGHVAGENTNIFFKHPSGSYPEGRRFKSSPRYQIIHGVTVLTVTPFRFIRTVSGWLPSLCFILYALSSHEPCTLFLSTNTTISKLLLRPPQKKAEVVVREIIKNY